LIMAVVPQVMARFVGLTIYQFDSNIRNSTMVGIVGGGGIGAPLFTAYQRFDYDVVLTILLIIIAIIMVCELISRRIRSIFQ
jgi:phosphonate transport system permease protein